MSRDVVKKTIDIPLEIHLQIEELIRKGRYGSYTQAIVEMTRTYLDLNHISEDLELDGNSLSTKIIKILYIFNYGPEWVEEYKKRLIKKKLRGV